MVNSNQFNDFVFYNDGTDFIDFLASSKIFSSYLWNEDSNTLKKAAKDIYDCIFAKNEIVESIVIIKEPKKKYIGKPYKLKKEVNDILSLVSDYSVYEDKATKK